MTKEELIQAIENGDDLVGVNLVGVNLQGANLSGANLKMAKFSRANLECVGSQFSSSEF